MLNSRHHLPKLVDPIPVAPIKNPLFDSFPPNQAGLRENFEVFTCCRLAYPKFAGNEHAAYPIFYQVSVHLAREVLLRMLQPLQNLRSAPIGEGTENDLRLHIDN